jgi:hypothetical protein
MNFPKYLSLAITLLIFTACANVFYSPDAGILAKKQKTIAIIPPKIAIAANKKIDANAMKEQQKTESMNFQSELYSWMLRRKMQGKITPDIQDIENTNVKLQRAGYPEKPLTPSELCDLLEVDGVLTSNFGLSKPMSEGAAIALGLVVGVWGSTNEVRANLSIHDCSAKKMIWNYDQTLSGGVGSSPARIVDQLMRRASRKMPYTKK